VASNSIIFILIFVKFILQEAHRHDSQFLLQWTRTENHSIFCCNTGSTFVSLKAVSLWKPEVSRKKFSDFPTRQFLVGVRRSVTVVRQVWKFGCAFSVCGARFRVTVHIISAPYYRYVLWAEFVSCSSDDAFWTSELTQWTWPGNLSTYNNQFYPFQTCSLTSMRMFQLVRFSRVLRFL
jgi:hypothetical protein